MLNIYQFKNGLQILPVSSSSIDEMGEMEVLSSDGKLYYHNGTVVSAITTEASSGNISNKNFIDNSTFIIDVSDNTIRIGFNAAGTTGTTTTLATSQTTNKTITFPDFTDTLAVLAGTQTLTNKTLDAGSNTISNLTNSNLSGSAGITGANIATNTVANSNLAQMSAHTFKGNNTGSTATPSDLTATQLTAELSVFVGDSGSGGTKGLVPAPAAGDAAASKFLKADGTWQNVSGSGATVVGTIDSQSKSVNGLVISGATIYAQSADATNPGMMTTSNQTIAGTKTFSTGIKTNTINDNSGQLNIIVAANDLLLGTGGSGRITLSPNRPLQIYNAIGIFDAPTSGYTALYFKTDNQLYSKDTGGNESFVSTPAGVIQAYGGTSAPSGYLMCDGQSYLQATYPNLFAAIGTAYGTADGTHFNVPDLRGRFLRGVDNSAGNDPDAASRTASNLGGNTGDVVGSYQADDYLSHTHTISSGSALAAGGTIEHGATLFNQNNSTGASGGNETRPKNVYVNYIIKT